MLTLAQARTLRGGEIVVAYLHNECASVWNPRTEPGNQASHTARVDCGHRAENVGPVIGRSTQRVPDTSSSVNLGLTSKAYVYCAEISEPHAEPADTQPLASPSRILLYLQCSLTAAGYPRRKGDTAVACTAVALASVTHHPGDIATRLRQPRNCTSLVSTRIFVTKTHSTYREDG